MNNNPTALHPDLAEIPAQEIAQPEEPKNHTVKDEAEFLATARKRFTECRTESEDRRQQGLDDLRFKNGQQYDEATIRERSIVGQERPCVVINKLNAYCNRVVNDHKQNRPTIKVRPREDTDIELAEIRQGLIDEIIYNSKAQLAFDNAHEGAVSNGFGFFRIGTEYCDDESFDQDVKIKRIWNPFDVEFPFHLCEEPDFSDVPYCFISDMLTKEEFKSEFPDVEEGAWDGEEKGESDWVGSKGIRVCRYYVVEEKQKTITDSATGKSRVSVDRIVKCYRITSFKILDEYEWEGKTIPVIPVVGQIINIEGKLYFISLIRYSKDPQKMYNYGKSHELEKISLSPKPRWIGPIGFMKSKLQQWAKSHKSSNVALEYDPVIGPNGQLAAAPQLIQSVPMDAAAIQFSKEASDDIKSTTSLFDASMGAVSNEKSGVAIRARAMEGSIGTFHFADNLNTALIAASRIVNEIIPKIYDNERIVRILGPDKKDMVVKINQEYLDEETGKTKSYFMDQGKFDIICDTGPSYASKREQATEDIRELLSVFPAAAPVISDIYVRNLDISNAVEISDRLKSLVPPQAMGEKKNEKMTQQDIAAMVQDIQKLMAENEQLKQIAQQQGSELQSKAKDREVEVDLAIAKIEADLEKTILSKIPADMPQTQQMLMQEISEIKALISGGNAPVPVQQTVDNSGANAEGAQNG